MCLIRGNNLQICKNAKSGSKLFGCNVKMKSGIELIWRLLHEQFSNFFSAGDSANNSNSSVNSTKRKLNNQVVSVLFRPSEFFFAETCRIVAPPLTSEYYFPPQPADAWLHNRQRQQRQHQAISCCACNKRINLRCSD